jgi:hypothetical protein
MKRTSNHSAAVDVPIARLLQIVCPWRRAIELDRYTATL